MVQSIWWDLGGTALKWDYEKTLRFLARLSGKDIKFVNRALCGCDEWRFAPESLMWFFDRGMINEEEFFAKLRRELRIGKEIPNARIGEAFTRFWTGSRKVFTIMRYLHFLSLRGTPYIQGIVSNMSPFILRHILGAFPALRIDDGNPNAGVMTFHTISCQVGTNKPHPSIFWSSFVRASLCHYEKNRRGALNRDECLFLDDNIRNVEAARGLGINAVLIENGEESVVSALEAFGIPLPDKNWTPPHPRNGTPLILPHA